MLLRSAKRTDSVRVKESTSKSEVADVESSLEDNTQSELEKKDQELAALEDTGVQQDVSTAMKFQETEEMAQPVTVKKEIMQEIEVLNGNSMAIEGLTAHDEDTVVATKTVELKVKEEIVEEEMKSEIVMESHVDVNSEDIEEGRGDAAEKGKTVSVQYEDGSIKNDSVIVEDGMERGENAGQGKRNEGGDGNDGSQSSIVPAAAEGSAEEETAAAPIDNTEPLGDNNSILVVNEGSNGEGKGEEAEDDEKDNEDDEVLSSYICDPFTGRTKQKDLEIFVRRLDKRAVEDDLVEVFRKFGEIKAAKIVRNPSTRKSKGFAFIRYATVEQAKNALSQLKDGIEVRGKHVEIGASQDNDTLYVGNISKFWSKQRVLGALKRYGIENFEDIHVPYDRKKERRLKGYALLEFRTSSDAMEAFHRLREPDAVFGRNRDANVSFTKTPVHPSDEFLSQGRTVYLQRLTDAYNEKKFKEICGQYGEIVKVKLSRSLSIKRKDFGFITFISQESALACVEGINDAQIGDREAKIKASIAKPRLKGQLQKHDFDGEFNFKKNHKAPSKTESEQANQAGLSIMEGCAKSKRSKRAKRRQKVAGEGQGKALSESKIVKGGEHKISHGINEGQYVGAPQKSERRNRKRKNLPSEVENCGNGGIEHLHGKRPSKKRRDNARGRRSNDFRNSKRHMHFRKGPDYGANSVAYKNTYVTGDAASIAYYQDHAYSAVSASKGHHMDMEPHAGYLEPVAGKQVQPYSGYLEPAVQTQVQSHAGYPAAGTQGQPHAVYLEAAVGTQGQPHTRYLEPTIWTPVQSHGGPIVGMQGLPHIRYLHSAVGRHGYNLYDHTGLRVGGHDSQGSSGVAYGKVGSAPPPSYVTNYSSYVGYEGVVSSGVYYHQSSGAYQPPGAYH